MYVDANLARLLPLSPFGVSFDMASLLVALQDKLQSPSLPYNYILLGSVGASVLFEGFVR